MRKQAFILLIILLFPSLILAQRPPRGEGRPPFPHGQKPIERVDNHPMRDQPSWVKSVDTNNSKRIEKDEFLIAANSFFKKQDKNNNGIFENEEHPQMGRDFSREDVPPFLFLKRDEFNLSKEQFDEKINLRFNEIDLNGDGAIDFEEVKNVRPPNPPIRSNTAMAKFIGAETRFGDKIVKNAPFSAKTVRTENKRLFDGSLIKNESKGLIYRDIEGRTRQEQPIERIGGFQVFDENNQPKTLVNIVDVVKGEFFTLNMLNKEAYKISLLKNRPLPLQETKDAKKESLGTKKIEGLNAEGTKFTVEIPVGQIQNDKPIFLVTEKWFSPELQMIIYSKHTDPFIGEVTFQLVNIKLGEPSPDLFRIPSDFKIVESPKRKN
jgi:hypothetical protein